MKTAAVPTHNPRPSLAFTLIEMLVVIAIIGILAALFLAISGSASAKKKIARVKVELTQLSVMIDSYKDKLGYYPPDNPSEPRLNTLFYELSGTRPRGASYVTVDGSTSISAGDLLAVFGVKGFANSSADSTEVSIFSKGLRQSQVAGITNPARAFVLSVPVAGPSPGLNTWRYVSTNPTNNPHGYDLWAEIVAGGKTVIIGNWKD